MANLGEASDKDLMRLSLEAAIQLDRLRRGKEIRQDVISALDECLRGPEQAPVSNNSLYLLYSPRTLNAYHRAGRTIVPSKQRTLEQLRADISSLLKEVNPSNAEMLRDFCLTLHETLAAERPQRRRGRPHAA